MKRRVTILIFLIIITACLSACDFLPKDEETVQTSIQQPEIEKSNIYVVKKGDISESVKCSGKFSASSQCNLCFDKRSGVIANINVKEGDVIKKGDIIAELNCDESPEDLKKEQFQIDKAKAAYNDLVKSNADSEEIQQASIDLQIAKLEYDSIQLEISKYKLISPVNGKIVKMNKNGPGEIVAIGEPVVVVTDINSINVECEYSNFKDAKVGMKAEVTYNGAEVQGQIIKIVNNVDSNDKSHSVPYIVIGVSGLPSGASLDDSVNVNFETLNRHNVIVIPKDFIKSSGDGSSVTVLSNNTRIDTDVKVGIQNDTMAEIVSGIKEGDKITN